ncbi:MAG: N(4)-acetylcytidine aminohydrolase [Spirochaetales bacterium]|nr:N(4)-acetylcytidine aminohydrolase [Spirochaetales bacterium]
METPTKITFFEWLIPFVEKGQKTITIRDESESHYLPGSMVDVHVLETDRKVCVIKIEKVEKISFNEINKKHALQEYMTLTKLKKLIREIYPDTDSLYVITFRKM